MIVMLSIGRLGRRPLSRVPGLGALLEYNISNGDNSTARRYGSSELDYDTKDLLTDRLAHLSVSSRLLPPVLQRASLEIRARVPRVRVREWEAALCQQLKVGIHTMSFVRPGRRRRRRGES